MDSSNKTNSAKEIALRAYNNATKDIKDELEIVGKQIDEEVKAYKYYFSFLDQIRGLRKVSFIILTTMMISETVILFVLIVLSSLTTVNFIKVDNITLRILVGATLTQVGTMMVLVIRSVFPPKLNDIMVKPSLLSQLAKKIE